MAIYRTFSTIFREALDGAPSQWEQIAMEVPSGGSSVNYDWLGEFPMMREWVGDRVVKDLKAFHYEIQNKNYESTIEVDRNHIEDDQIGLYSPRFQQLGVDAKKHPDLLIYALLKAGISTVCYDGQNFFSKTHKVKKASVANYDDGGASTVWYLLDVTRPIKPLLLQRRKQIEFVAMDQPTDENVFMRRKYRYGVDDRKNVGFGLWQLGYASNRTLNATYYSAARAAMMSFKNDESVPLGIVPNLLVVPPTLESAGRSLLKLDRDDAGAGNPWYNTAELLVVPWLA